MTQQQEQEHHHSSPMLFSFRPDGTEVNGLLPSLKRRVDLLPQPYFEPQDTAVMNLLLRSRDKAILLHETDACWALEACRGDVDEALFRIQRAQQRGIVVGRCRRQHHPEDHVVVVAAANSPTTTTDGIGLEEDSYASVPLHWMFRRHVAKHHPRLLSSSSSTLFREKKTTTFTSLGGKKRKLKNHNSIRDVLLNMAVLALLCQYVSGGGTAKAILAAVSRP